MTRDSRWSRPTNCFFRTDYDSAEIFFVAHLSVNVDVRNREEVEFKKDQLDTDFCRLLEVS